MKDLYKYSIFLLAKYEELLYLQSIELMQIRILNLFLERKMEITEEIRREIDIWVGYVHGNAIAKYFFRKKTGGEPLNPLRRLEEGFKEE